jgi:diacylglycerol kinase family enzyme
MTGSGMRIHIVMNIQAGALRGGDPLQISQQVVAAFTEAGHQVSIDLADGPQLRERLVAASRRNDIDVLVACGGDGTISTAAGLLKDRPIALGVLPGGTMNMYARTLRLPIDPVEAARALAHGEVLAVDSATAGGHLFLHQISFGIQPHAIKRREQMRYGSRIEKIIASVRSLIATLRDPPQFTVEVVLDGDPRLVSTSALVVSNNVYGDDHLPYADQPDGGLLGIYAATSTSWSDLAEIGAALVLGGWKNHPKIIVETARRVRITPLHRPRSRGLLASIDGETKRFHGDIEIAIHPKTVKILAPSRVTAA